MESYCKVLCVCVCVFMHVDIYVNIYISSFILLLKDIWTNKGLIHALFICHLRMILALRDSRAWNTGWEAWLWVYTQQSSCWVIR